MKKFLTLFSLIVLVWGLSAAEFAKALNYRIVLSDKAGEMEKAAAAELKLHLSKSYKKAVKLNGKTPKLITFFVGNSKEAAAAGLTAQKIKNEFLICRKGDNFLFAGIDTRGKLLNPTTECGTFHSVAYFVQKYMAVKIFMPGPKGIKYASDPEITFKGTCDAPVPSYGLRGFQRAGKGISKNDMLLFFRRRLGRIPLWTTRNYSYFFLYRWGKRFQNKPEMFALLDGQRVNEKYPRHFPCTSNPAVLDQVEKDIAAVLKKRPDIHGIRFFSDAPVRSCECSNCRNSAAGKLVTAHDHSETVYAFFCRIAQRVLKHKQGLYFHIQTKGTVYSRVPQTEKLPPNTVISVLGGHFMPMNYAKTRALCDSWRKAGARVLLYAYPRAPEMKNAPLMNPHRIADYYKNLQGAAEGTNFSEGRAKVPYSFSALNNYIHSAVMFDIKVDTGKLIDEFCRLAAPVSFKELKSFYTAMEKLLDGAGFRDDPRFNCYAADRLKAPRKLLGAALAKDPGNAFLKQLTADFDNFVKESFKVTPEVAKYLELQKIYKQSAPRRQLLKLSQKPEKFLLMPFVAYENYQTTEVFFSCDKKNFKFKVICKDNEMKDLRIKCRKNHEGPVWSDDSVEFFFSAPQAPFPYIHLAVNAKGIYRAQLRTAPDKGGDLKSFNFKSRSTWGRDQWQVEGTIPLKLLSSMIADKKMQLGLSRCRSTNPKRKFQLSSLQRSTASGFHDPANRITVEFP